MTPKLHFLLYVKPRQKCFYKPLKNQLSELKLTSSLISDYYSDLDEHIDLATWGKSFFYWSDFELTNIIARCRVLRNMPFFQAVRYIYSATSFFSKFLGTDTKYVFISTRVDTFIHHIAYLISKKYPDQFDCFMFWKSPFFNDSIFLTSIGESSQYIYQSQNEHSILIQSLQSSIKSQSFKATSIKSTSLSFYRLRTLIYRISIWPRILVRSFTSLSRPNSYISLYYKYSKPEYISESFISLLLSLTSNPQFDFPAPNKKNIVFFLQVNPESTIDYYMPEFQTISVELTLRRLFHLFESLGYSIYVKDHPNMCLRRSSRFFDSLKQDFPNIKVIDPAESSQKVIASTSAIFTWSGTVLVQGAAANVPVFYYNSPFAIESPLLFRLSSHTSVSDITSYLSSYPLSPSSSYNEHFKSLLHHIASLQIPLPSFSIQPSDSDPSSLASVIQSYYT